jgi:hypothetical protein
MMDYDPIVAQVLALLQQETGVPCDGGMTEVPCAGTSHWAYLSSARSVFLTH